MLERALRDSAAAGLPTIAVSPAQGKLLHLLARIHRAGRILEVGTLGGYSTIWMARALPADGHLITLELDPSYAKVARANIDRAGLGALVEVRVGPAIDSLRHLVSEARGALRPDLHRRRQAEHAGLLPARRSSSRGRAG